MLWPNGTRDRPPISSAYGWRVHPITKRRTFHAGTDFVGFRIIRAIAPGIVRVAGTPQGWAGGGRQVWIQHDGYFTRNMHLSTLYVHQGQHVEEGQALGIMGATGAVTGVHLHIELTFGQLHYGNSGQLDIVPFIRDTLARPQPAAPAEPIEPEPVIEEEEEMRPKIIHRNHGGDEWMLVHPSFRGPTDLERGYLVTTSEKRAIAWARVHGNGWAKTLTGPGGRYTASVDRDGYLEIQAAARAEYDATVEAA